LHLGVIIVGNTAIDMTLEEFKVLVMRDKKHSLLFQAIRIGIIFTGPIEICQDGILWKLVLVYREALYAESQFTAVRTSKDKVVFPNPGRIGFAALGTFDIGTGNCLVYTALMHH
jgi:hypothetical protein